MVSCHSIAKVGDRLIGDPLDIEMFNSTQWRIEEDSCSKQQDYVELSTLHSPSSSKLMSKQSFFSCTSHSFMW
jgi:hypothetical protein